MEDCIFCKIIKRDIPSFKVYEDDKVFAFADVNPISEGHTLIVPKKHAENILEIDADDLVAIHAFSKKLASAMTEVLKPDGIAILQLNGRGVNQVVMHYHLHLIPRVAGGPEIAQTSWELKPGDMDAIGKTAEKIASAMK